MFNLKLAGDDGLAAAVAVVEHLQQAAPVRVVERGELPIVNHERIYFCQLVEQARQPNVISAAAHAASLVRQRAGQPGLADGGRVGQLHVLLLLQLQAGQ